MTCKKHPYYKAKFKPTADCRTCKQIWTDKKIKELKGEDESKHSRDEVQITEM